MSKEKERILHSQPDPMIPVCQQWMFSRCFVTVTEILKENWVQCSTQRLQIPSQNTQPLLLWAASLWRIKYYLLLRDLKTCFKERILNTKSLIQKQSPPDGSSITQSRCSHVFSSWENVAAPHLRERSPCIGKVWAVSVISFPLVMQFNCLNTCCFLFMQSCSPMFLSEEHHGEMPAFSPG